MAEVSGVFEMAEVSACVFVCTKEDASFVVEGGSVLDSKNEVALRSKAQAQARINFISPLSSASPHV
jgi:hypothetical protein